MRLIGDFEQPTADSRARPPLATPLAARLLAATLLVAALLAALPVAAGATPALTWSAPAAFDSHAPTAVACASESLCVAVDEAGEVWTSASARSPAWTLSAALGGEHPLTAVSCASSALCVAVDRHGDAFVSTRPAAGGWSRTSIDGSHALTGVSCPSASLCVAVDEAGDVLASASPAAGEWTAWSVDPEHALTGVSCYSQSLCVAVDDAGDVLASSEPAGGPSRWPLQRVDFGALLAVSCPAAAPAPACVAVDGDGDVLASADPGASAGAPAATWSVTPIADESLTDVSCGSASLCVAVDARGEAWASDDPQASAPAWAPAGVDSRALASVWCLPGGSCVAVDSSGYSLWARVPALRAITLAAPEASASSATLAGEVDPSDALVQACWFEYGTGAPGSPYTQSVPCAATPPAGGGAVSAALGGLTPNTAYHYRVVASTAAETSQGLDTSFTTGISPQIALVTPHPSIAGTPAPGQRLTCNPGTPAGASAKLAYAWLRDQIPLPEQLSSTYTVKNQDSGHHLQCQVTATDGGGSATARSGFATVPMGGVPAAAGETTVGKASVRGLKVSVPLACSPHAGGGCRIALRVTTANRRPTLALASSHAHIGAGARATVTAAVGAKGRRLLASLRRVPAYVYVAGTVIGVIEAQLSRQRVTLTAPARRRARRAGRGRAAKGRGAASRRAGAASGRASGAARGRASAVLAATPYMGWDTYFALGGRYSESTILSQASKLISLGLVKRGYRYVWLDAGWWHGTRAANGEITVSAKQWPHGLAWLTRTLHAAGLLVGLYTDAGPNGCGGAGEGSYGHYQQDVNTFAAWGFDAVKVDFCGGEEHGLSPAVAYSAFHQAIEDNSSHRPMLLSICNFLQPEQYGEGRPLLEESAFASYTFGPSAGNSWRTDTDVGLPGNVPFGDVLRNLDADAANPQAAGPGHWNDPDYLAPGQGMSATQFRSQVSMWAMLAAPLMVSANLEKLGPESLAALANSEVIAVDQDPAGVQGTLLSSDGARQVWVKPLVGGERAIALLNRGSSAARIETSAGAAGLPAAASYSVRNLWTHTTSSTRGAIAAEVPAGGTVLLRLAAR